MKKISTRPCFFGLILLITCILFSALPTDAQDITQWRNNRDGIYQAGNLLDKWPEGGPKMLWVIETVGEGYSSPIIVNNEIFITSIENNDEFIICLDMNGKEKWRTVYSDAWGGSYREARTTPTYLNGRLYVISGAGKVAAIDAATGKLIWVENASEKYKGDAGRWGFSEAPLIVDDKVIFTAAGDLTTMVALNCSDGSLAWKTVSLGDGGAYVSPLLITHNSKKQIVGAASKHIFGVNPDNGAIEWKFDYLGTFFKNDGNPDRWIINCNTPVFQDGRIFVTSGYDHCGVMLELNETATAVKLLWKTDVLDVHHGHVVLVDGYLYGANWVNNNAGNWACIEWKTGQKMWEEKWHNKGSIIYADGMLYIYDEQRGNVGLVKASPKAFELVSSFQVTHGSKAFWAHPVIHNGVLYIRHGEALMAYDIKK